MAAVPLDSSLRQRPIHPDLPGVRVPGGDLRTCQYHPVTAEPFSGEDLRHPLLRDLLEKYGTPELAAKAQQAAVREARRRMEENESKRGEVERQMRELEGMREIERKVYQKQVGQKQKGELP